MSILSKKSKTPFLKKEEIKNNWYLVNAEGKTLGRLASKLAHRIRGKHLPTFTPNQECGDNIIVINAEKVKVSGNKNEQKIYYHHSRYPGGMKQATFTELVKKKPEDVIRIAVEGMLPDGRLGRKMINHLKVFSGQKHNLQSQKPVELNL